MTEASQATGTGHPSWPPPSQRLSMNWEEASFPDLGAVSSTSRVMLAMIYGCEGWCHSYCDYHHLALIVKREGEGGEWFTINNCNSSYQKIPWNIALENFPVQNVNCTISAICVEIELGLKLPKNFIYRQRISVLSNLVLSILYLPF